MVNRLRLVLLGALVTVLAIVAGNVFDEVQWKLVGAVGAIALVLVIVASWRTAFRVPVSMLAVAGGVAGAVLWVGGERRDIVPGLESGPRRLITSEWPSPVDPVVIGTLTLMLGLALFIGAELTKRPNAHLAPLAPAAITAMVLVALGAPVSTSGLLVGAVGILALLFTLARSEPGPDGREQRPAIMRADRTVVASVVGVAVIGLATSGAIALADRADPRRPQNADSSATILDPIEAAEALRRADPAIDLFRVIDESTLIGRSLPARWRTAALTEYDGQRWVPLVTVRPIGGRLGLPSDTAFGRSPSITYSVRYLTDDLLTVPFPGRPLQVDQSVRTDTERVVVMLPEAPDPNQVIEAVSEIDPGMVEAQVSNFGLRQIDDIAVGFSDRARAIAGTTATQFEQLQALESTMRDAWQLDADAPGAGQQLTLIERFIVDTQRGTREQFVTAFVLLARSLGFDARIATGFIIPPEDLGIPLTIRSSHAAAWPEVRLADNGWVAFDPVPDAFVDDDDEPEEQLEPQSPAAAQPPILPPADEGEELDETPADISSGDSRWTVVGRWAARVGVVAGLTVLPFALVTGGIVFVKWRRRRQRRLVAEPDRRIRAEWANTTDYLIDAGLDVEPSWTDERIAEAAAPLARRAPFELRRLASLSTAMTFGSTDNANVLVLDALETSRMIDAALRSEQTTAQRLKAHLSLRSLRKATRSPVVV